MGYIHNNSIPFPNVSYIRMGLYARVINARPTILRRPSTAVLIAFTEAHGQSDERSRWFLSTEVARARRIDGEGERDRLRMDGRQTPVHTLIAIGRMIYVASFYPFLWLCLRELKTRPLVSGIVLFCLV